LVFNTLHLTTRIKISAHDRVALHVAKDLVEASIETVPSIMQLCRKSGLNSDKLKKGFKLLFGYPPHAYHLRLKIEAAKKLLTETEQNINEIAWTLGYEHASNFCIQFKKATGVKAGAWRAGK
jgi:AraC-like DNA-binding protein